MDTGYFHLSIIANNDAVNVWVQISFPVSVLFGNQVYIFEFYVLLLTKNFNEHKFYVFIINNYKYESGLWQRVGLLICIN